MIRAEDGWPMGARRIFLHSCLAAGLSALLTLFASHAHATDVIDPAKFETFCDREINECIAQKQFPGAAIVLVENGKITFSHGYGVSDLETRQPIDPQTTGFRTGSMSKLLTTIAILQQVERGKLSLTDPIQKHLPDIPIGRAGEGVTVHNLLTHTDGFEVGWSIGGAVLELNQVISLADFLKTHIPARIVAPGQMYIYGDVGMALVGHILENVDGRPFERYAQEEILTPLGMKCSTFEQTSGGVKSAPLAQGYRTIGGTFHKVPYEYVRAVPSAGLTSTAADVARFMMFALNGGELDGHRIIGEETIALTQNRQFAHHPALLGTSYGFYERVENGQRVLQHGGLLLGYNCYVWLIPARHIGVFMIANAYGEDGFRPFSEAFLKEFFTAPTTNPSDVPRHIQLPKENRPNVSGQYRYVVYPHRSLCKLCIMAGMTRELRVTQLDDGSIIIDNKSHPFEAIDPLLYAHESTYIAFRQDQSGQIIGAAFDLWAFERIEWYEARGVQKTLGATMAVIFLASAIVWLIRRFRRNRSAGPRYMRGAAAAAGAINLLMAAALAYYMFAADIMLWFHGLPKMLTVLSFAPWLSSGLTLVALVMTARHIRSKEWRWGEKLWQVVVLLNLSGFVVYCMYWNLIALPGKG